MLHLQGSCPKATMCSLAGEQWHILKCRSCITRDGCSLLGLLFCESGATFVNTQIGTLCLEQRPLEDTDLYFLGTR